MTQQREAKSSWKIKVINDTTGTTEIERYDDYQRYLARFSELRRQHIILHEETASVVRVARKGMVGQPSFL